MSGAENQASNQSSKNATKEDAVSLKGWLAVMGSAVGAFMAVLDIQITSSSMQNIQGALGASLDEGSWISTAYLIAEIVTIPLTGWLSQVFGVKRYVVINAVLFVIFSMCCGLAHDLNTMIIFRALQGFTGGTLIPMSFLIILSTLPPAKQPIGLAMFSLTAVFATTIGPAIGGFLTDTWGWQYAFYLNLFPGLLLIAILFYALPSAPMKLPLLKQGDYLGIATMAIGLSTLTYALEEGQRKDWFGSPLIVNASITAAVFLTIFFIRELTCKYPLVNLRLLGRRNFGLGSVANVALGLALYGSVYLLPLYLTITQSYSAWQIGQVMIWSGMPQLFVTPFVPKLMSKIDPRVLIISGLCMFGGSCFLTSTMTHDFAGPQFTVAMLIRALGQPFIMVPLSSLATAGIEKEQAGSASALFNMMRNLGGSFGIALVSTLLTQREQFHSERLGENITASDPNVRNFLAGAAGKLAARGSAEFVAKQQALGQLAGMVKREAYVLAFNDCFMIVGMALVGASLSVMLLQKPKGKIHAVVE